MNMEYLSTKINPQQYKRSTISHITTIRRHAQKQKRLTHQKATNSQTSATTSEVVNLVVQYKKALLLNCSNFSLSLVFSSAALVTQLHGNKFVKIKHSSVPVKPKSWPPTSATHNSNPLIIVPTTS